MLKALILDVDGTIADTEKDGHRVAFNMAFSEDGLKVRWDVPAYGRLLKITGGKERIQKMVSSPNFERKIGDVDEYVKRLHKRKTEIFMELVESGKVPLRKGIKRLIEEAHNRGIRLAVTSTSNEKAVHAVLSVLFDEEMRRWFEVILAGDVVSKKKPDPEIYHLTLEKMNLDPGDCLVVEDSRNGLIAAKKAGMKCIVTTNVYTKGQNFSEADLVVDSLSDPGSAKTNVIYNPHNLDIANYVSLEALKHIFSG